MELNDPTDPTFVLTVVHGAVHNRHGNRPRMVREILCEAVPPTPPGEPMPEIDGGPTKRRRR